MDGYYKAVKEPEGKVFVWGWWIAPLILNLGIRSSGSVWRPSRFTHGARAPDALWMGG